MDGHKQGKYMGRVEICHQNYWKSICPSGWNNLDAMVTCRQLGLTIVGKIIKDFQNMLNYYYVGARTTSSTFGLGQQPAIYSDFSCTGSENSLLNCSHTQTSCTYSYHAGVKCEGESLILVSLCSVCCQYSASVQHLVLRKMSV